MFAKSQFIILFCFGEFLYSSKQFIFPPFPALMCDQAANANKAAADLN
jgi:hypothetical protein